MRQSRVAKITPYAWALLLLLVPQSASFAQTDAGSEDLPAVEEGADGLDAEDLNGSDEVETEPDIEELIALFLEDPEAFLESQDASTIEAVVAEAVRRDPGVVTRVLAAEGSLANDTISQAVADGIATAVVSLTTDGNTDAATQVMNDVSLSGSTSMLDAVTSEVNGLAAEQGVDTSTVIIIPEIIDEAEPPPPEIGGADDGTAVADDGGTGDVPSGGVGDESEQAPAPNPSTDTGEVSPDVGGGDAGLSEGTTDPDVSPVN